MAITAPGFLLKYPYIRKRTRDFWCFWYLLTRGRKFIARRMGFLLLFDLDDIIDRYLLAFGSYEELQRRTLFAAAQTVADSGDRRVFLDIGAHWGVYSLWAHAAKLFDRVVAVEADPSNLAQLHANLFLNDLTGAIDVVGAAASSAPGDLAFNLAGKRSRNLSKVASLDRDTAKTVKIVRAVRIDDVEPMRGGVVVAKIDVEGYEHEVITGMRGLLTGNRGVLQVEVWPDAALKFDRTMAGLGYSMFAAIESDRFYRNF